MKINSHLLGFLVCGTIAAAYFWWTPMEVEVFMEYRIYKARGKFQVERLRGTMDQNPTFNTIEEAKAWIATKMGLKAGLDKVKTLIPWGN